MLFWFRPRRRNKKIFRYWNGSKMVGIDPIEAFRSFDAHPELDLESIGFRIDEGDSAAMLILCDAVQKTFNVHPWRQEPDGSESGLTIEEQVNLAAQFIDFIVELKKNIVLSPMRQPPTGPEISPDSPSETTNDSADSGSISDDPKPGSPGPSIRDSQPLEVSPISTGSAP